MMMKIGLIKEGKKPPDNRVALTPEQCNFIENKFPNIRVVVQSAASRCFSDDEYRKHGVAIVESLEDCDMIIGIKEVPVDLLISNKTFVFFSHTKKLQPHNKLLINEIVKKKITLIDFECLEHYDGTRILGFGFFAGIVGAHHGIAAYGRKTGSFDLENINPKKNLRALIKNYFGLKLPNIKIAVTGTGRVAHGILEVMNLLDIKEVDKDDYQNKSFPYPVYVHLKGIDLYQHKINGKYSREYFHQHPKEYKSIFTEYLSTTDILMNGLYWEEGIPQLFEMSDISKPEFKLKTIADISDDIKGSIPCNIIEGSIESPVYGIDLKAGTLTAPYLKSSVDVIAVSNLPNVLPLDASEYFGEQIIKELIPRLLKENSTEIENAIIIKKGDITQRFSYMSTSRYITSE
ncbi:MAG: NAD(P)-dependent oxidoreductase [Ginsengibacter sp.]